MKCSFKPCKSCTYQCRKAGRPSTTLSAIEREKQKADIKRNGCLYERLNNN